MNRLTDLEIKEARSELSDAQSDTGGDWESLGAWAEKWGERLLQNLEKADCASLEGGP